MAFCWLPPDMLRAMVMGPWPERTSYCSISLVGVGADIGAAEEAGLVRKFRLKIALEHQIVLERIVQHETVLVPVFGDVAHAHDAALADGGVW